MELAKLDPAGLDSRLGPIDAEKLARAPGVIVNIEYPLGLAAYNILREITTAHDTLRGVYVLGKAATLNADVGDVLISGVIHDEHSGSTYWLDNAFSFDDIAPYLVFGSGLDNQRAVTVKSTFLQNRNYLDFYYREAYTVVEMEAGPFCNAVYEIADADRYPSGEAVNFAKLPIDFGIIHYASDTPYSQARTLGARGLVLLRPGLDLRVLGGDPAADPGPGGAVRRLRGLLEAPDPELERLYTCELGLTSVPEFYGALPRLRTLDLGHNALTSLPDLSALTRLEILYLHDNALTSLPALPPSLTYLNVSENPLPALALGDFPALLELRALDLGLSALPARAMPALRELHLRTQRVHRGPGGRAVVA